MPSYQQLEIPGFTLALNNFEGPFDLLLQLINSHKLDVTEVALGQVTDEFIAYTTSLDRDLSHTTEFLLIAATLLDLKTARLLPRGNVENEADLELLEARDLLFAKLLQYKAYKEVAAIFAGWQKSAQRQYTRDVALEDRFVGILPPLTLNVDVDGFAAIAAEVFSPKTVNVEHVHESPVSVPEQARLVQELLAEGPMSMESIFASCETRLIMVGRFLALLELYKERKIDIEGETLSLHTEEGTNGTN
ncbi:MAG: segregation/condensation protein A [Corynebacterium sp.]|nr:segregation/condensation protein A [Corynebacterium sp.]